MKPTVRTITGFLSIKDFARVDRLIGDILALSREYLRAGYAVQTVRITTDVLEHFRDPEADTDIRGLMEKLRTHDDVSYYHLGSVTGPEPFGGDDQKRLLDFFMTHQKAFMAVDAGRPAEAFDLCHTAASLCTALARIDPFECLRFGLFAGVNGSTPFYPASKVGRNSMKFAVGVQCANCAVEEALGSKGDRAMFETRLTGRLEREFAVLEELIPPPLKPRCIGFDTSLAPFPSQEESIAHAIETVLGQPFGSSGTLSMCRILTRAMKQNRIPKTGLCGLMLPVIEDNVLALRGIEGRYSLKELLLYSSVCATGLDTVPVSGDTSPETLAECYHDLVTLALTLEKPLSARLVLEPDKRAGDTVRYDWEFAAESRVFSV